jgi:serine/threonine-protein kinase
VYCALERQTGEILALKNLEQRRFPTQKFLQELSYLVALQHPNIVTWQGIDYHKNERYLIMDYCAGGTLRDLIEALGRLSLPQILSLITDILLGLSHAHERRIIHCDIKPENILLAPHPRGWTARISDFGIARMAETLLVEKKRGGYTGSPAYMAPERFYGKSSYASDVYAVGILLYELLTGERPFSGFPAQLMAAHLSQPVSFPDTIPLALQPILEKALRKLPQRRYSQAQEMLEALQGASRELGQQNTDFYFFVPLAAATSSRDFKIVKSFKIEGLIKKITIKNSTIFWGCNEYFCYQVYQENQLISDQKVKVEGVIYDFFVGDSNSLVISVNLEGSILHHSLYQVSGSNSRMIGSFPAHKLLSDMGAQSRWMAIFSSLDYDQVGGIFQVFHLPSGRGMPPKTISPLPEQLMILDQRYGIAFYPEDRQTVFKLFNRRGHLIGNYSLPLALKLMTRSLSIPYQFLALEKDNPFLAVLVRLKPLKLERIPLDFVADQIVAHPKGYILANRQGKVVYLSERGEQVYYLETGEVITAIAVISASKLIIATPTHLHTLSVG